IEGFVEIFENLDDPGRARALVAGDRHEIDAQGQVDRPHQVGEKQERTLEDPDDQQLPSRVGRLIPRPSDSIRAARLAPSNKTSATSSERPPLQIGSRSFMPRKLTWDTPLRARVR